MMGRNVCDTLIIIIIIIVMNIVSYRKRGKDQGRDSEVAEIENERVSSVSRHYRHQLSRSL